jgi:hypothetical protein
VRRHAHALSSLEDELGRLRAQLVRDEVVARGIWNGHAGLTRGDPDRPPEIVGGVVETKS